MRAVRLLVYTLAALLLGSQAALAVSSLYLRHTDQQLLVIIGGSMEPLYSVGDAVILDTDPANIDDGDVITYREDADTITTHRVIDQRTIDGTLYFQTQGDANPVPDPDMTPVDAVIGQPVRHIPHGGQISMFLQSPTGRLVTYGPALSLVIVLELAHALRRRPEDDDDADTRGHRAEEKPDRGEPRHRRDGDPTKPAPITTG